MEIYKGIRAIKQFDEAEPITTEIDFRANTFSNELTSQTIKDSYNQAAKALADKSSKIETYSWDDVMGWPRVSTVLQTPSGHVEVCGFCNNDNDSIAILFRPGKFTRKDAKKLSTHEMPKGVLRCD